MANDLMASIVMKKVLMATIEKTKATKVQVFFEE
jgi:hypothetical protein